MVCGPPKWQGLPCPAEDPGRGPHPHPSHVCGCDLTHGDTLTPIECLSPLVTLRPPIRVPSSAPAEDAQLLSCVRPTLPAPKF